MGASERVRRIDGGDEGKRLVLQMELWEGESKQESDPRLSPGGGVVAMGRARGQATPARLVPNFQGDIS